MADILRSAWDFLVELAIGALTLMPVLFVFALIFYDVKAHL